LTVRTAKKTASSHGFVVGHGFQWLVSLFIKVVNCGVGFWVGNLANQCNFRVAMSSPTIRSREQADLARYRSFVVSRCGFGFDITGWVTACPVTAALASIRSVNVEIVCLASGLTRPSPNLNFTIETENTRLSVLVLYEMQ